ncbi:hypothetical protein [Terrarubrum flagellatum]|uniref:hypothetical protein n=1 Tax=Terrirubrum flagellatum TaxID=2895980 RepID=UPI0031453B8C
MLSGIAALAAAAAPGVAIAAEGDDPCAEIKALVAAYEAADAEDDRLALKLWETEDAYQAHIGKRQHIPTSIGKFFEANLGRDAIKKELAKIYRAHLFHVGRHHMPDDSLVAYAKEAIRLNQDRDFDAIDRAFDKIEADIDAFGLSAVQRAAGEAKDARNAAFDAICSYRCATMEQAAIKMRALLAFHEIDALSEERVDEILRSFLPIEDAA